MPLNFLYHPAFKGRSLKLNQQAQRIFIFVRMSYVWHLLVSDYVAIVVVGDGVAAGASLFVRHASAFSFCSLHTCAHTRSHHSPSFRLRPTCRLLSTSPPIVNQNLFIICAYRHAPRMCLYAFEFPRCSPYIHLPFPFEPHAPV